MRTKLFKGQQVSKVMNQIREEIGDEAFIVSMIENSGQVEIEVGIDDGPPPIRLNNVVTNNLVEGSRTVSNLSLGSSKQKNKHIEFQIIDLLKLHGLNAENAKKISSKAIQFFQPGFLLDKAIASGLDQLIECNSLLPWKSKIVALCGSTGVGKTTTIAKLAARLKMSFGISIGLIAADSYRVGAGFHLQTYASILNLPFQQINSNGKEATKELLSAVNSFSKYDLVLIDTAGCGPKEENRIEDLQRTLSGVPQAERILVLPAPSNDKDLHSFAKSFARVDYSRIILSKIDESGFIGPIVNTLLSLEKPLAFITNGQRVPEDIEPASNRRLAWMLTRELH